ncbi:MAG: hypothetical protein ACI91T_001173 [Natronomonas sp.]|jgi:hypothetical protein
MPGSIENLTPSSLNPLAVVGLILFTILAVVGLFALPTLMTYGVSFRWAFAVLVVVEYLAAVGAGVSAYLLYDDSDFE